MNNSLIAPCGMNCGICVAYLRVKNKCCGCRSVSTGKSRSRMSCRIKNCDFLTNKLSGYCYECIKYPCARLMQLDKRYRTKYGLSMINNLNYLKKNGLENFILVEKHRWKCKNCGATLCVHRNFCLVCNSDRFK